MTEIHDITSVYVPLLQSPTRARRPMSMEEPFEFQPKADFSRKCDFRKSLPAGSTLERSQRAQCQSGISNGNGTLYMAADVSQVSVKPHNSDFHYWLFGNVQYTFVLNW